MVKDNRVEFAMYVINHFNLPININEVKWEDLNEMFEKDNNSYFQTLKLRKKPSLKHINWVVSNYFGFNPSIVREGKSRKNDIVRVRQICHYIAVRIFDYDPDEVGPFFNKHRTLIFHSIKTIKTQLDVEIKLHKIIKELVDKLKG